MQLRPQPRLIVTCLLTSAPTPLPVLPAGLLLRHSYLSVTLGRSQRYFRDLIQRVTTKCCQWIYVPQVGTGEGHGQGSMLSMHDVPCK